MNRSFPCPFTSDGRCRYEGTGHNVCDAVECTCALSEPQPYVKPAPTIVDERTIHDVVRVLAFKRPTKAEEDAVTTDPRVLVAEFAAEVAAGRINPTKISMHYFVETPDGSEQHHWWQAGMRRSEQIAFIEFIKHSLIDDWRN